MCAGTVEYYFLQFGKSMLLKQEIAAVAKGGFKNQCEIIRDTIKSLGKVSRAFRTEKQKQEREAFCKFSFY